MNLYLIGYCATGKTTLGAELAQVLKRPFADSDEALVNAAGTTIENMVSAEGWPKFRQLETAVLQQIAQQSGQVVATGDGIILDEDNRAVLRATGVVVWFQAAWETIYGRMVADAHSLASHPSLSDQELAVVIRTTLAQRGALYAETADFSVITDTVPMDEVVEMIMVCLKELPKAQSLLAND